MWRRHDAVDLGTDSLLRRSGSQYRYLRLRLRPCYSILGPFRFIPKPVHSTVQTEAEAARPSASRACEVPVSLHMKRRDGLKRFHRPRHASARQSQRGKESAGSSILRFLQVKRADAYEMFRSPMSFSTHQAVRIVACCRGSVQRRLTTHGRLCAASNLSYR
jgi:hypothetical protein